MKKISYNPSGVCSKQMNIEIDDEGIIRKVQIVGGCAGNTQGVSRLVEGMNAKEAAERIRGIKCGFKATSCPNELAKAILKCIEEEQ